MSSIRDYPERWEVVGSQEHFRGRIIRVRSDQVRMPGSDGPETVVRDVIDHPGSVGVLALDGADRVLLIRQYRHAPGYMLWEAPAGLRDVQGEPTWKTAERELLEEAGYRAARWHTLVDTFTSPGMSDERKRIFLARDLTEAPAEPGFQREHEEADMPVEWVPLDEAVAKVLAGDIHNPTAVVGILAASAARAGGFRDLRAPDAPEG
ncbi:NUDIX hydrolase [Actinomadura craniellae]|uniref:NUDIX hydrolase n=1 Tax=Actinomadura craniellae TaxID=2231787 RepID=A0A365HDT1_9ACTN|nr:NUDIX hydrolase [Actinomadura craniellae]RAY16413.1 NUDIX hydrolase [Actinomadura craniellae]